MVLTTFPNTEKRVENTTASGVFLTNVTKFKILFSCGRALVDPWRVLVNVLAWQKSKA